MLQKLLTIGSLCSAGFMLPASAVADPITMVVPGSLSGVGSIDFEDLTTADPTPGAKYDGIVSLAGADFVKRFLGQVPTFNRDFDVFSSSPSGPLLLYGSGNMGYPSMSAVREGSFAAPARTRLVGERVLIWEARTADGGEGATVSFLRRHGSPLHESSLPSLGFSPASFGFVHEGTVADIAGISVHNYDVEDIL